MTDRREPPDDAAVVDAELVPTGRDPATSDPAATPDPVAVPEVGYTAAGVPTFDHVRESIEGRVATAAGAEELDAARPDVASLEQQEADRAAAGRDRLEEIRRSLRGEG